MTVIGLLFAMIGLDPVRGAPRFTFGVEELFDGIGFVPVVMGLFGVAELLLAAEKRQARMIEAELKNWMPTGQEMARLRRAPSAAAPSSASCSA